ncbi:hypothetical protein J4438_02770 [Candidatus Woesearchaeota archaeon]|nr:hypothetical protein [Candidatus Woesearchaeota archaeon]
MKPPPTRNNIGKIVYISGAGGWQAGKRLDNFINKQDSMKIWYPVIIFYLFHI